MKVTERQNAVVAEMKGAFLGSTKRVGKNDRQYGRRALADRFLTARDTNLLGQPSRKACPRGRGPWRGVVCQDWILRPPFGKFDEVRSLSPGFQSKVTRSGLAVIGVR